METDIYVGPELPLPPLPPHHYALLQLPLFESDPARIHEAVLSQDAKLRRWALHPDRAKVDRALELLNELGRASFVLEDPQRKAEYDQALARELGVPLPPSLPSRPCPSCPACGNPMRAEAAVCPACGCDVRATASGGERPLHAPVWVWAFHLGAVGVALVFLRGFWLLAFLGLGALAVPWLIRRVAWRQVLALSTGCVLAAFLLLSWAMQGGRGRPPARAPVRSRAGTDLDASRKSGVASPVAGAVEPPKAEAAEPSIAPAEPGIAPPEPPVAPAEKAVPPRDGSAAAPKSAGAPAKEPDRGPVDTPALLDAAAATVVSVFVYDRDLKPIGQGSGFIVRGDGLVATNYQFLAKGFTALVVLPTGARYPVLGLVDAEPEADLALLKLLRKDAKVLPALRLEGGASPEIGARVWAIGSPSGSGKTVREGVFRGYRQISDSLTVMETTAAIGPGSSGGPLLSASGGVVGVTTAARIGAESLSLALPADRVSRLMAAKGRGRGWTVMLNAAAPPNAGKGWLTPLRVKALNEAEWRCEIQCVDAVLRSAAGELWRYFPERQLPPIEVTARGGPLALYHLGFQGQIRVQLETGDRFWSQIAYQFSQMLLRILCNSDDQHLCVKWFEDGLCEAGALFILRRMAGAWQANPPFPNWRDYSRSLRSYADDHVRNARLPEGATLAQWYRDNAAALRVRGHDFARGAIVGAALLPMFESSPEHWEAITYLNDEPFPGEYTLADYLRAWQQHCPENHRAFVGRIAAKFGINLPE